MFPHLAFQESLSGSLIVQNPDATGQVVLCRNAVVLPSYGMTECMPIATPGLDYKLDREGTSGLACGPSIAIFSDQTKQPVPPGTVGHIVLAGSPLFLGYEDPQVMTVHSTQAVLHTKFKIAQDCKTRL